MNEEEINLKGARPCPFCGSDKLDWSCSTNGMSNSVYCKSCLARGTKIYVQDTNIFELAIKAWNGKKE